MAESSDVGTEAEEEWTFPLAGIRFPLSPLVRVENIEKALSLRPQVGDVILSSYPKCDSKCIDAIIWKLLYPNLKLLPLNKLTNRYLQCIEMETDEDHIVKAKEYISKHKLPRLIKTYLPFKLIPFYKRSKYIYVIRTPWDVCVSYYKLLSSTGSAPRSFDQFFKNFLEGNLGYGCYFRHVSPWNKRANESNVLILCHEHVEHNPRSALFTIAAFLGDEYLKQLLNFDELERKILDLSSPEQNKKVKKSFKESTLLSGSLDAGACLWDSAESQNRDKLACSKTQIKEITEKISEKFKDSSIEYMWLNLLKKYDGISVS